MLDIQFIRDHPDEVKSQIQRKRFDPALVDQLIKVDAQYRELLQDIEQLRAERNKLTKEDRQRGIEIKQELKQKEPKLNELKDQIQSYLYQIPNLVHPQTPQGKSDQDNPVLRQVGTPHEFKFQPLDHLRIGERLDLIDFEAGAKVSGSQFYYLKNEAVLLEFALAQYAMQFLSGHGFIPIMTPDLAKEEYYLGTGYLPQGEEAQTYTIENTDLGLIATAEVTLAGYHADHTFSYKDLPLKYVGFSHCFRQEAGAYGKFSKGLYRVHQFSKVEMYAFTTSEQSEQMHQHFLEMEEQLWQSLEIPYQVVEMCDADLGSQAIRKYDLEAWMPGKGEQGAWGEVTSTSNTTDYQARRLNIKYKDQDGQNNFVHTLNGTALPVSSRAILAILENYQQSDGSVAIPKVLQPFVGKDIITSKAD